jgi:hypothetical protein
MAKQNEEQKKVVGRVMHEFKHGELERGRGGKVKNPKQAIAIALSEAGASDQQSPSENRRRLKQTEAKQRKGQTAQARKESGHREPGGATREELYRRAQQAGVPGRSHMTKDELQRALHHHGRA